MKTHPAADLFPMLDSERYKTLRESIRANGLRHPIVLCDGMLLDGRNRAKACAELGIEPAAVIFDGDPWEYAWDSNAERRDLSAERRAAIWLEKVAQQEAWQGEVRRRQAEANRARAEAAKGNQNAAKSPLSYGWRCEQCKTDCPDGWSYCHECKADRPGENSEATHCGSTVSTFSDPQNKSSTAAAEASKTNRGAIERQTELREKRPDLAEQVRAGEITPTAARREMKHGVHFSSETVEHYTPEHIIESAMHTMGDIDLDPCADPDKRLPAGAHFTKDDDGLTQEWGGRVYMNPPYGREIRAWVDKLRGEFAAGRMEQGIALVPARTDTAWWSVLADYPVCFISGRLTFIGNSDPAPFPSAVVFVAHEKAWPRFATEWQQHGLVYVPWGRS